MIMVDTRACSECAEPLDGPGARDPFALTHPGCCSHPDGSVTAERGQQPYCSACGSEVEPTFDRDEDGFTRFDGWVML